MSASPATKPPTIFVAIASYRDPDLAATMADLFAKAAHPETVRIGVCLQWVPETDQDCRPVDGFADQVKILGIPASESQGACWARHRTQAFISDEDYYFQIDSHMRFVQDWDRLLVAMLASAPSPRAVLSTYPLSFEPPNTFSPERYVRIFPKGFDSDGILLQRSTAYPIAEAPATLQKTAHLGAGLLFAPTAMVREVPYDPYLYFQGEEITLAARLWTHGWDLFTPNAVIAYHDYSKRPARPRHWEDQQDWSTCRQQAARRLRVMLGMEAKPASSDDPALQELDRYGLGTQRSLADYQTFSGVDFQARLIDGKPGLLPDRDVTTPAESERRQQIFRSIWDTNGWKAAETRSGNGSTLAATARLRPRLLEAFRFLGIESLADAGCGDANWIADLLPALRFYLAFDIVPAAVAHVEEKFRSHSAVFTRHADIVRDTLPACDAILCRDVLTHLPVEAALAALQTFQGSKSRYLIATTHDKGRNQWVSTGGWYPIDLCAPPFNLPSPLLSVADSLGSGTKTLGIWALDQIQLSGL